MNDDDQLLTYIVRVLKAYLPIVTCTNLLNFKQGFSLYFRSSNHIFKRVASASVGGPVYQDLHLITMRVLDTFFVCYLLYSVLQISMDQGKLLSQVSFDLRHQ